MSDSAASLRRKIASAGELESVVRTMKAMAASSIAQYENAVRSLDDYYRTVQLGLAACFRHSEPTRAGPNGHGQLATPDNEVRHARFPLSNFPPQAGERANESLREFPIKETGDIGAVVFGSDQGLVGQFNDVMVEFAVGTLGKLPNKKIVCAVGERIQSRLAETDMRQEARFILPNSISAITPLVGQILVEMETQREKGAIAQVYIFHNRPESGAIYKPVSQRLLPLDETWRRDLAAIPWPTKNLPEIMNDRERTLRALVREYLFVSLFRACAESLASENASRLAAMQRAEKNIDELLEDLNRNFHRLRQNSIDEELFDVVSGFEALTALQYPKEQAERMKGSR